MNLLELKERVDFLCKACPYPETMDVVITTNDHYIGKRAGTKIQSIYQGFDWEFNEIRIETTDELIKQSRRKD